MWELRENILSVGFTLCVKQGKQAEIGGGWEREFEEITEIAELIGIPWGGGRCTHVTHGRSRMTTDPRIPTMPGRITLGFHRPDTHR